MILHTLPFYFNSYWDPTAPKQCSYVLGPYHSPISPLQLPYKQDSENAWPGRYSTNGGVYVDITNVIIRIVLPCGLFLASVLMTRFWYLLWWLRPSWIPLDADGQEVGVGGRAVADTPGQVGKVCAGEREEMICGCWASDGSTVWTAVDGKTD